MTVTSPNLPVNQGVVKTRKEFSDGLTQDLTDYEISRCFQVILPIKAKWEEKFRAKFSSPLFTIEQAMELVDQFEDELKTELREKLSVYASIDVTPLFEGEPMIIDFHGALPEHSINKYGLDHEAKTFEVKKATAQGEDYLGEKGKKTARKK